MDKGIFDFLHFCEPELANEQIKCVYLCANIKCTI